MNILVNSSYRAVITDFGSARAKGNVEQGTEDSGSEPPRRGTVDEIVQKLLSPKIKFNQSTLELTLTGPGYTLRWTAPEVLSSEVQDLPSDMWALGWTCWEVSTQWAGGSPSPFAHMYHCALDRHRENPIRRTPCHGTDYIEGCSGKIPSDPGGSRPFPYSQAVQFNDGLLDVETRGEDRCFDVSAKDWLYGGCIYE